MEGYLWTYYANISQDILKEMTQVKVEFCKNYFPQACIDKEHVMH